jgi:hypothetical protein
MTLILTIANSSAAYQSSDYRLVDRDTLKPVTDLAGTKQLQASFRDFSLRLAFTGIATGTRGRTIDLLSNALKLVPQETQLEELCEALSRKCEDITRAAGNRGVLELVLIASAVAKPFRVAVISNIDWQSLPLLRANAAYEIRIHPVDKPFVLISGYRDAVPLRQKFRLRALARDEESPPVHIMNALSRINAIAAKNSKGIVSENCWVTSVVADGRIRREAGLNVGQNPGNITSRVGDFDIGEFVRQNFEPAPGKTIRLIQTAGVVLGPGDGTPQAPPEGDPRRFTLSGSSITAALRSSIGNALISVAFEHHECILEMRLNDEAIMTFGKISLGNVHPVGVPFAKPRFPWPQLAVPLTLDGAAIPRGWEYSIGYWVEEKHHHLEVLQCSRSIRDVAFLSGHDEIIIVSPTATLEFSWQDGEEIPSVALAARVRWQTRTA